MKTGEWLKPPGTRVQHFILKPANAELAQRHSACDRLFLFGSGNYRSKAKHCPACQRASGQEADGHA